MSRLLFILIFILFTPFMAFGELFVCFHEPKPLGSQFSYGQTDPLRVTDPACSVVTKASGQTESQLALINSTIRGAPAPKYLKVVSGLAAPMTETEMNDVDTAIAAKQAYSQTFVDEVNIPTFCGLDTLAKIDQKVDQSYDTRKAAMLADVNAIDITAVQTAVDAVTNATTTANIAAIKNALTVIGTQLNNTKTALTTTSIQIDNERVTAKQTLRCLLSVRKGAR